MLVILASITKRAQIPFSAWLPAAMAAPTPVSALVHSSTLVTAGVYLLIRFSFLIEERVRSVLFLVARMTSLMAGFNACIESDLKKIIALSTLSQLGFIIIILALGFSTLAFYHLLTHAVFKALLFICGGKIIHEVGNRQDCRLIGGLREALPFTRVALNLSRLSLCGFPFLAGFYSKDLIVEKVLIVSISRVRVVVLAIRVGLSSIYSVRLIFFSLLKVSKGSSLTQRREEDFVIVKSKFILSLLRVIVGASLS